MVGLRDATSKRKVVRVCDKPQDVVKKPTWGIGSRYVVRLAHQISQDVAEKPTWGKGSWIFGSTARQRAQDVVEKLIRGIGLR